MNLNNLTIGEAKQLASLFGSQQSTTLNEQLGERVIIRTYSAGVWFGVLDQKSGNEVILKDARRMWQWHAKESISLSGVANYGLKESNSRIAPAISTVWLEAIEILSCTDKSIISIEGAEDAKPQ
ncbi:MAG: hypothetical protein GY694_10380 [Gammaproteobacteria bacterium]|nr:hypothetical protein [Gammaproteobacteria bacterium]